MNPAIRRLGVILGVIAAATAATTLCLDRYLGYRIGENHYFLYQWSERLGFASLIIAAAALVFGIASRHRLTIIFALISPLCLLFFVNPVHSGPNPEAWCYNHLRAIDGAKTQLALEKGLTNGTIVTAEQISSYINGGSGTLKCMEHGEYTINPIGIEPRCSVHGSTSEMEEAWKERSRTPSNGR